MSLRCLAGWKTPYRTLRFKRTASSDWMLPRMVLKATSLPLYIPFHTSANPPAALYGSVGLKSTWRTQDFGKVSRQAHNCRRVHNTHPLFRFRGISRDFRAWGNTSSVLVGNCRSRERWLPSRINQSTPMPSPPPVSRETSSPPPWPEVD